jgi:CheY-like chemotaxis protein
MPLTLDKAQLVSRRRRPVTCDSIGRLPATGTDGDMSGAFSTPGAGSAERPRVLLADDHSTTLAVSAEVLAGECLIVARVDNGSELLAEAERLHPDVVVLDITMPRLDGIEAARQLRALAADLPASSFSRSTKMPTTPEPRSTLAGSAMSSRRGSLPISWLPSGRCSPIASSSRHRAPR